MLQRNIIEANRLLQKQDVLKTMLAQTRNPDGFSKVSIMSTNVVVSNEFIKPMLSSELKRVNKKLTDLGITDVEK